jgi:hypothetical protein
MRAVSTVHSMSESSGAWPRRIGPWKWTRGAVGGFLGSVAFGLWMMFVMPPPVLEVAVPQMYGISATPDAPAYLAGWFFHLYHGVVLGLVYVAVVEHSALRNALDPRSWGGSIAYGVGYGVVTTLLLAVIVMPLWLGAVGFPGAPPFPNISVPGTILGLIGHVVFALGLSLVYGLFGR